jgi:hypothetical protein
MTIKEQRPTAPLIAGYAVVSVALIVLAFMVGHYTTYFILSTAPQENSNRVLATVKAVCDYGRDTTSGESEEACGIALDTSHTEYNCNSYTAPTHTCWVEERP